MLLQLNISKEFSLQEELFFLVEMDFCWLLSKSPQNYGGPVCAAIITACIIKDESYWFTCNNSPFWFAWFFRKRNTRPTRYWWHRFIYFNNKICLQPKWIFTLKIILTMRNFVAIFCQKSNTNDKFFFLYPVHLKNQ